MNIISEETTYEILQNIINLADFYNSINKSKEIESLVYSLYDSFGLSKPNIYWCSSPLRLIEELQIYHSHNNNKNNNIVPAIKEMYFSLEKNIPKEILDKINKISSFLYQEYFNHKIYQTLFDDLNLFPTYHKTENFINFVEYFCLFGHWQTKFLMLDKISSRIGKPPSLLVNIISSICKEVSWWAPYDKDIFISSLPIKIWRDENKKLHHESEPAIKYNDEWGIYCWHGIRLPSWMIKERDKITLKSITEERNLEIRRAEIEIYGWDKFLADINAKLIATDKFGQLVETDYLHKHMNEKDKIARFVIVKDSTTAKDYALRTLYSINSPQEAIAWSFNLERDQYSPSQET